MKVFPYWAKASHEGVDHRGKPCRYDAWGWSRAGMAEAHAMAMERARQAHQRRQTNEAALREYDYLSIPLREEVVEELCDGEETFAAITRNRYGALVLNTAGVCFIDIDYPYEAAPGALARLIMRLFPGWAARRAAAIAQERKARELRTREWMASSGRAARLYQTAAGLRLLLTDRCFDPTSEEVQGIFRTLQCDRLYQRLTLNQKSFRARLTPKPWRCGCAKPPGAWPREGEEARQFAHWLQGYEAALGRWGTCTLLETTGPYPDDSRIARVVRVHDAHACAPEDRPLA